jgi:hypothetical protein
MLRELELDFVAIYRMIQQEPSSLSFHRAEMAAVGKITHIKNLGTLPTSWVLKFTCL